MFNQLTTLLIIVSALQLKAQTLNTMKINTQAPLQFRHEIFIAAHPEKVWKTLSDMEKWNTWNNDIEYVNLKGELKEGTQFIWKEKGAKPTSYLQSVKQNSQLGWTGTAPGMKAVHIFNLIEKEGGTLIVQEESLEGWMVTLLKPIIKKIGNDGMTNWNQKLKEKVETL